MSSSTISDFVLVPMETQAVVVNDKVLSGVAFVNGTYDYENVPRFQTPAPRPFDDVGTPATRGVHLLWEMPAAFRQGRKTSETIEYPLVPNRWMVVRYWPGQTPGDRQMKAWVLLSDYLGADGKNSFLHPTADTPTPTRLGKAVDLSDFAESAASLFLRSIAPGNLTFSAARMNAQSVFSHCDDLSDITLQPNQTVYLSYLIVGWYSDPTQDPLHGASTAAAWAARTAQLQWLTDPSPYAIAGASPPQKAFGVKGYGDLSTKFAPGTQFTVTGSSGNDGTYTVAPSGPIWDATDNHLTIPVVTAMPSSTADGYLLPAGVPASWPTQSLIHGLLYNVSWQNFQMPPRPNSTPTDISANVKIAVGNSAIDALAAMIVAEAKTDEGEGDDEANADAAALEAFQANMLTVLDKAGGQAQLDMELRGKWFTPQNGGILWTIVTNPDWKSTDANFEPNTAQQQWLADLNFYQRGLDRETRVLESMEYDLYALWWRTQSINAGSYIKPLEISDQIWNVGIPGRVPAMKDMITASLPAEAGAVYAQQQNVALWQKKVDVLRAAPPSYQSEDTTVSIYVPPAPQPVPVPPLLLKEVKMPRFFEPQDPVILISGLGASVNLTSKAKAGQDAVSCRLGSQAITGLTVGGTLIPASSLAGHVPAPANANLPPGVAAASATLALEATLLDPDNASFIAKVSGQAATDIAAAIRAGIGYTGLEPDPFAAAQWEQAWIPIFLDWNVTWYPTVSASVIAPGNTPNWRFTREGWAFDGLDYNWTGGDVTNPAPGPGLESYTIASVNVAAQSYTIAGVGNLGWRFPSAANGNSSYFSVSGSSASYQVQSTSCDASGNFTIFVAAGTVTAAQAGQTITPTVLPGWTGGITYTGRTFLTPSATFNFRSRLEQYLNSHGGRYSIASVNPAASSFVVNTAADLSSYFLPGGTFYVAQSTGNNGTYRVASRSFNAATGQFTVVATQGFPSSMADGVLVADPLADAAHLLDIIGGARYTITAVNSGNRSVTVDTEVDLNHLFPVGGTFYLAETEHSNGTYTVASSSYDENGGSFTIVAQQPVPASGPHGVAVPEPREWDILSQSLSGFSEQLLMRDVEPNQTPTGTVPSGPASGLAYSVLVGDQDHTLPMLSLGDASQPSLGNPAPYYFPMRGGYFALRNLALVDRFGQKIDLLFGNQNNQAASPDDAWKTFGPIRSRWLTPEDNTPLASPARLIKLPPRAPLGSRLDFRFVSAPDTNTSSIPPDTDIDLLAGANPVAGWILPNHLDNGLLVYDAEGNSLGELVLSRTGTTPSTTVRWFPVPMSTTPITNPTDPVAGIPNQYLRGFVAGLLNLAPAVIGDTFSDFLQTVDETLWTVDPLGGRTDQNMSVLVGRPLALVRARLQLVTDGMPTTDQSTKYAVPNPFTITAVNLTARSFSFAMSVNLAESGQFEPGSTIAVSGSTGNDGVYHVVGTAFDGSATFTVFVDEPIASADASGTLQPQPPEGGLTNIPLTLRLGRPDLFDDGLIGYFIADDYSRCYNVHAVEDSTSTGYLFPIGQNGGNYLSIQYRAETTQGAPPANPQPVADPYSIFLTMLVDPRGTVNATTGILPTEELSLPAEFYTDPIARLELFFRTGPLLIEPEAIRMPRPTEQRGTWNWIQKNDPANTPASWEADPIAEANDQARFPTQALQLRDGWLRLTGTDLES